MGDRGLGPASDAAGPRRGRGVPDQGRGPAHAEGEEPTDVALVNAKLAPGGHTGWHRHAGPPLVVVKAGQIAMYAPASRRGDDDDDDGDRPRGASCEVSVHNAGTTFVHPESAHNFVNTGKAADGVTPVETEFYIVYFVPAHASRRSTSHPLRLAVRRRSYELRAGVHQTSAR